MASRQETPSTILVFYRATIFALGRIGSMPHHLQVLDIKVVVKAETNCFLLDLVRRLTQKRMRRKLFHRIDFRSVGIRNAWRKHMTGSGKPPYFGHPDSVQLSIGRNAVIVVIGHLTIFIMFRIQTHISLAVLQGIFGVNPTCSSPVTRKACTRSQVDYIENRGGIIQGVGTRITHVFRRRIHRIHRIAGTLGVIVEAVVKVVVELFQVAYKGSIFVSFFVFIQFEGKELSTHAVLDIRNFAFHHVRNQVMVLTGLHRKALVGSETARISQLCIGLLVQDGFRIESLIFTDTLARNKGAGATQGLLAIRSQILVVGKANIVAAIGHIEFFEIRRIRHISVQYVAFLVTHFPRQGRTFETSLITFDNVSLERCIPIVVCGIIEAKITHVITLLLVATELGSQKTRLTSTLQRSHDHRQHRHRHIGNIQHHRTRGNRLFRLHHHAPSVEIEVLVSGIVTGTEVATGNLNSLVRQPAHFHAVQLLVVLISRSVIDFANATFHIVLEPHTRKGGVLGFAQYGVACSRQNAVFLIEQNGVRIQGCRAVLELGAVIQVKGGLVHIVNQVHCTVFNGIYTGRVIHPIHFGGIFFDLFPFFQFKTSHLLAESGRSGDGKNP